MGQPRISTSYLSTIFYPENFPKTIRETLKAAKKIKKERDFDTIAFCGMSGAAVAFILASEMSLPLLCVRKKGESSHYVNGYDDRMLEGNITAEKYLLVDDFISSGKTVNYIMDTIKRDIPNAKCVAMLMYSGFGGDYRYRRAELSQEWDVFQPRQNGEY